MSLGHFYSDHASNLHQPGPIWKFIGYLRGRFRQVTHRTDTMAIGFMPQRGITELDDHLLRDIGIEDHDRRPRHGRPISREIRHPML